VFISGTEDPRESIAKLIIVINSKAAKIAAKTAVAEETPAVEETAAPETDAPAAENTEA
jgi:hypothetical protein